MSAGTAYYVGLSFFPLLLILIAGIEWFLRHTHLGFDAQQKVFAAISQNMSPDLADYVSQTFNTSLKDKAGIGGPMGAAMMLITSLAAFAQLDSAFDRIWLTPQEKSKSIWMQAWELVVQRGRAFLQLLALGAVVVIVFLSGMVLSAVETQTSVLVSLQGWVWNGAQTAIAFVTNTIVFALLYRLLPKVPVSWGEAMRGGLFTAIAWEIGRQVLTIYVARSSYTSAYGVVGAFLAVLLWCYYAAAIVLLGAEYIQVIRARNAVAATKRRDEDRATK